MEHLKRIQDLAAIKTLTDPRRLEILRILMTAPATLTQLGQELGEHPAQVRHHLKLLEKAGLVELVDQRVVRGFVEKYYNARARAFIFNEIILPNPSQDERITFLGSHDLALEAMATRLRGLKLRPLQLYILPVGSLEGLVALRQGIAQIAGCHLLDAESGEYNLPYIRHLFPDRAMRLITLAHREQGLILPPGNPLQLRGIQDFVREDVRLANRNRGSGTRLWLDLQLRNLTIQAGVVRGYNSEHRTHTAVAEAISTGKAGAGIGLQAAAQKLGLDFIPLFQERFDLVYPEELVGNPNITALFDTLTSGQFRRIVQNLGGYETARTGDELLVE